MGLEFDHGNFFWGDGDRSLEMKPNSVQLPAKTVRTPILDEEDRESIVTREGWLKHMEPPFVKPR